MSRRSARILSRSHQNAAQRSTERKRRSTEHVEQEDSAPSSRKQQFRIQYQRLPISQTQAITSSMIVPNYIDEVDRLACAEILHLTGDSPVMESSQNEEDNIVHVMTVPPRKNMHYRFSNHFYDITLMPNLTWADRFELLEHADQKEARYQHSMEIFTRHPALKKTMRSVLLAWLTEVCEVYKLHRQTFYLAIDYVDRFLLATTNIKTTQLQLLGVTALYIAAKIEEIYPPKCTDFVFVGDGAFEMDHLFKFELMMMKSLNWFLNPETPNAWVLTFLQMIRVAEKKTELDQMAKERSRLLSITAEEEGRAERSWGFAAPVLPSLGNVPYNYHMPVYTQPGFGFYISPTAADQNRDFDNSALQNDSFQNDAVQGLMSLSAPGIHSTPKLSSSSQLNSSSSSGVSDLVVGASHIDLVGSADVSSASRPGETELSAISVYASSEETDSADEGEVDGDCLVIDVAEEVVAEEEVVVVSSAEVSIEGSSSAEVSTGGSSAEVSIEGSSSAEASYNTSNECSEDLDTNAEQIHDSSLEILASTEELQSSTEEVHETTDEIYSTEESCSTEGSGNNSFVETVSAEESSTNSLGGQTTEERNAEKFAQECMLIPSYCEHNYLQTSRLLDLAMLDGHSLMFSYKIMAAAALYLATDIVNITKFTGTPWHKLRPCVEWMKIHKDIISRYFPKDAQARHFAGIPETVCHRIQCHTLKTAMWEEANERSEKFFSQQSNLDLMAKAAEDVMESCGADEAPDYVTPPRSTKKIVRPDHPRVALQLLQFRHPLPQ